MFINKIKSEGLSHNSYFIGSENEAIVIDPRRDCQIYIDVAQQEEIIIKGIFKVLLIFLNCIVYKVLECFQYYLNLLYLKE